jgi:hypothetical protein
MRTRGKVQGEEMEVSWKKWRNMGQAMAAHIAISDALGALANVVALRRVRGLGLAESVREVLAWQKERIGELELRNDSKSEKIGQYEGAIDRAFDSLYGPLSGLAGYQKEAWYPRYKLVGVKSLDRLEALAGVASEAIEEGEKRGKYIKGLQSSVDDLREEVEELRIEKRSREKSGLAGLDDTPEWARDKVFVEGEFSFSFVERLRVLFGRPHRVRLAVFTEWKPGRTAGDRGRGWLDPLFRWPGMNTDSTCAGESKEEGGA